MTSIDHNVERGVQVVTMTALLVVVATFLIIPVPEVQQLTVILAVLLAAAGQLSSYLFTPFERLNRWRVANDALLLVAFSAVLWAAHPYSLNFIWLFFLYALIISWRTGPSAWATLFAGSLLAGGGLTLWLTAGFTNPARAIVLVSFLTGLLAVGSMARLFVGSLTKSQARVRRLQALVSTHKETDKEKTEILSLVTHQLKTPLALIRWSTEAVLHNHKLPAKEVGRLNQVIATTHTMYRTIEDLSHLFKLTTKGQMVRWEDMAINEIVSSVIEEHQAVASQRGISIKVQLARGKTMVRADKVLLKHAVANLVDNAIKYSFDKGAVTVDVSKSRGIVTVIVSDHGIGIEPANIARLFVSRFFRSDRAREHNEHGTGLGLYLVAMIMKRLKGSVDVTSQVGKGSTFVLSLPALD